MGTQETGKTLKVTALHHWGNGDCKKGSCKWKSHGIQV